jgi:VIT1/CCC1 family predicted Fe2+/Mn2+ transporter
MIAVRDFRCNGCGAPLPIPKNSKGHVKCPSCKTECVIEGLVKNAEMAAKENINSGFPLSASSAALHRKFVSLLIETPNVPLDIFEKAEIIREEHYCVPSYLFYCNGTASYTYEAGNVRQHKTVKDLGDKVRTEWENYMEWTQMSGTANASATVFSSGNRQAAPQIKKLYMFLDPNKLIDFDDLEFPHDVITPDYNLPQSASFNEYIKPHMEKLLKKQAEKALEDKETRDLSMGGSRVDKDETVRVFLGLYRVVFTYGGKEYSVWMTGDGARTFAEELPVDAERQKALEEVKKVREEAKNALKVPKTGCLRFFMVFFIIPAIPLLLLLIFGPSEYKGAYAIASLVFLALVFTFGSVRSKKRKKYHAKEAEIEAKYEKDMAEIEAQAANVVRQFKEQKKTLRGIYEELSGDASAFPA